MPHRFLKPAYCLLLLWLCAFPAVPAVAAPPLPQGFVYVDHVIPDAVLDIRYYTENNFVGARVDGYLAPKAILSEPAALALAKVQADLAPFGLGIKIFDGYRPQRAVAHFVRWAADLKDTKRKALQYPDVEKKNLFRDGFIAEKSSHSRGSTVDLTIVDKKTGETLDMGGIFDFFGEPSWPSYQGIAARCRANRALLHSVMRKNGFLPLKEEWWHFTLQDEPYPDTYFDFLVQ